MPLGTCIVQSVVHPLTLQLVVQVVYVVQVKKIKSIYHALNMFNLDVTQRCLIAECWCPVEDLDKIQLALTTGTVSGGGEERGQVRDFFFSL